MERKIVLASNNKKKMKELRELLAPLGVEVIPQGELQIEPAEEPYLTFVENALAKARHASRGSGLPAVADDSGLCVDVLGGMPGVRSARFAGEHADDATNNKKLMHLLEGIENRKAHYVCAVAAVRAPEDPEPLIVLDRWEGKIALAPSGEGGFGYDPFFIDAAGGKHAAEMSAEEKNSVSHRGKAMRSLLALLKERWGWDAEK